MKKVICLLLSLMMCMSAAALAEDAAPVALTDSVLDGVVELNGVVYQMPMPAQELLDNGWVFVQGEGPIKDNQIVSTRVEQNGYQMSIKIANVSGKEMSFAEAPVVAIIVYMYDDTHEKLTARFSNAVSLETSFKELKAAQGKADKEEGGGLFDGGDGRLVYNGEYSKYFNVGHSFSAIYRGGKLSQMEICYMPDDFHH